MGLESQAQGLALGITRLGTNEDQASKNPIELCYVEWSLWRQSGKCTGFKVHIAVSQKQESHAPSSAP